MFRFMRHTADNGDVTGDPHMSGLRGQHTEWSGKKRWLVQSDQERRQPTAHKRPRDCAPSRGISRQAACDRVVRCIGRTLARDPYTVETAGCLDGIAPWLADGALRVTSDGSEDIDLTHPRDNKIIHSGGMVLSATNLPAECTKFGGDKIWAETFTNMQAAHRVLDVDESFEEWVLDSNTLAAPEWCAKYISECGLEQVQSTFVTFKIQTSAVTLRLNEGTNYQGGGDTDWDGRLLPDIEFWQMDVGLVNLHLGDALTGILGEMSRPVLNENGVEIMEGPRVIRGNVEDYRLAGPLDRSFAQPSS